MLGYSHCQNIDTPALLSDNYCNYKCFGIHTCISFVCIGTKTKKENREKKSELIKMSYRTQKMNWAKILEPSA